MENNSPSPCINYSRSWHRQATKNRIWVEMPGGVDGWIVRTAVGVCCTKIHRWSGRLVAQLVFPYWLLDHLDVVCRKATIMDFFKKPNLKGGGGESGDSVIIPQCLLDRAPTLGHFLCDECWPGGEVRQRSSLVVFVEDGVFKACLSDKDSGSSLWSSCRSFDDLLEAIEARLTDDRPDWRKAKFKKK